MQDRIPLYPGRVVLTPVSGQANTYDMTRADQPTQEGTPLNKASLLKDATAALFDLGSSAVPDDMLNALAHTGDLHVWKRTQNGRVDYPVSPNPNAYQEGGPKPSGYTLGPVTSGRFGIGQDPITWASAISVSDNGIVSLSGATQSVPFAGSGGAQTAQGSLPGSFVLFQAIHSPFNANTIYFIPTDATFTYSGLDVYVNKYQTVTGYPAIPSDTTIEYVGQLGGGARIEVGSYVGTGTYGQSNPTVINYEKMPKVVIIQGTTGAQASAPCILLGGIVVGAWVGQDMVNQNGARVTTGISGLAVNWAGDKVEFYNSVTNGAASAAQCNLNGVTYKYIMII